MATPAEVPRRVAPASIIARAAFKSQMPPEAFTPNAGPTVARSNFTSATVAPPELKPVEVFTKCAPL